MSRPIYALKWLPDNRTLNGYRYPATGRWTRPVPPEICRSGYHVIPTAVRDWMWRQIATWQHKGPNLWIVECRGAASSDARDRSKRAYESIRLVEKVGTRYETLRRWSREDGTHWRSNGGLTLGALSHLAWDRIQALRAGEP